LNKAKTSFLELLTPDSEVHRMAVSTPLILHCEVVIAGVCRVDFSYMEPRLIAVFPRILQKEVSTGVDTICWWGTKIERQVDG
jgi:hypothetical protein